MSQNRPRLKVVFDSRDKDLLDLMTGYSDDCKEFRRKFRTLKIVKPAEFLTIIKFKDTKTSVE